MSKNVKTACFGYPKIGPNRELKKAVEGFWNQKLSRGDFFKAVESLCSERIKKLIDSNPDYIPSGDFSLYDPMLDLSTMFGVIPKRFSSINTDLDVYFAMARGTNNAIACEMTKWFDTNYHYIVPEISGKFEFKKNRTLDSYKWVKDNFGVETTPSIIGPFTFIYLSKGYEENRFDSLVQEIAGLYNKILKELEQNNVKAVRIEEPALVLDITEDQVHTLINAYNKLKQGLSNIEIHVQTYYESLSHYQKIVNELPVEGIGIDFIVNNENFENIKKFGFPENKKLIAGVVSGRDLWKTNYKETVNLVNELIEITKDDSLIISNSCPLFHLPVSIESEKDHLDNNLLSLLSFANERLEELNTLKSILNESKSAPEQNFEQVRETFKNQDVLNKVSSIDENEIGRAQRFESRYKKQLDILNIPDFPTTTIGSFPQTKEVRKTRADYRKGLISKEKYKEFIKQEINKVIELQEKIGLDVLVHGEFERTDMVEFFGQKLEGFAFTNNGWVQSYGSRCVKPPIIYGDVSRTTQMTVEEIAYAQSRTNKPVKGMLTGPVTILNWSFFRKDITKKEISFQLALALKDEVLDLEKSGVKVIQIDEAAFREGMPLKKAKQKEYLGWAVKAFKLSNQDVKPETQIHTHMCYSEFNEILDSIYAMDSDVISIEASRSKGEVIEAFEKLNYNHGIGLGVYDIHSPRVPSVDEIKSIAERSIKVIDKNLFWINPDCGLKTRGYEETVPSLENMVEAAKAIRKIYSKASSNV